MAARLHELSGRKAVDLQIPAANASFFSVQAQGTNIRHYYPYLLTRAKAFRDTKVDWVREGQGRLKKQTVDKGLLRETESVQTQVNALLKCDVSRLGLLEHEPIP